MTCPAMTATLSHSSYTCDGTAKRPAVTVWENGAAVPEHNYTVSYQNNRQVGTATVTITGVGNYRGSITKSFSIKLAQPQSPAPPTGSPASP